MSISPYEALANAVIMLVVRDLKNAYRKLSHDPTSKIAAKAVAEHEEFFKSAWFGKLTTLDGEWLIGKLRKEYSL